MTGFRTVLLALALGAFAGNSAFAAGVGGNYTDTTTSSMATLNGGTNVSVSKDIDTSSNIAVGTQINGVAVDYGLNGASVLGAVNSQTQDAAGYNQQRHAPALQLEGMVLGAVGLPTY